MKKKLAQYVISHSFNYSCCNLLVTSNRTAQENNNDFFGFDDLEQFIQPYTLIGKSVDFRSL